MGDEKTEKGVGRRTFLKTVGFTALGLGASALPTSSRLVRPASAGQPGEFNRCRLVVFGVDGLRIDHAQTLSSESGGLSVLNEPICATCGGTSSTQAGWASIFSGLPSLYIKCWSNRAFRAMPAGFHIVEKLVEAYGQDLYIAWITGKGRNIKGNIEQSPHYAVNRLITVDEHPGLYFADLERKDDKVFELAMLALTHPTEAPNYANFICFIHFRNPDHTGHQVVRGTENETYMDAARRVDSYIYDLMNVLPGDTDIIYCSDHGFDFVSEGDCRDGHVFSPYGMLATNFSTLDKTDVSQTAIGRLIYRMAGGNADWVPMPRGRPYRMFGEDLV